MKIKAVGLVSFMVGLPVQAEVLDFIYGDLADGISTTCAVVNKKTSANQTFSNERQGELIKGKQEKIKGVRFTLAKLLANKEAGKHQVVCTSSVSPTGEEHQVSFEVVKFTQYEYGSHSASYDNHGFAYGSKLTKHIRYCVDRQYMNFDAECVAGVYGTKQQYLLGVEGDYDMEWRYRSYSSAIGVFLVNNPTR